jgi:hypothetical protein
MVAYLFQAVCLLNLLGRIPSPTILKEKFELFYGDKM